MKVVDLRCGLDHRFEGWFASEHDCVSQLEGARIDCPLCGAKDITRLPSAPRLNLSGESGKSHKQGTEIVAAPTPADVEPVKQAQAMWMRAVQQMFANTEDVGERFAEEARRIHYGEKANRGIRGKASRDEAEALRDEGIEVMSIPVPAGLGDGLQ